MPIENLVHHACANERCGHTICLKPEVEQRLRRSHETFYCPARHPNYFPGRTDEEKQLAHAHRMIERWVELAGRRDREITRLRRVSRTCPLCDEVMPRTRARLYRHLTETHGANVAEAVE